MTEADSETTPEQDARAAADRYPGTHYADGRPKMHRHFAQYEVHEDSKCDRPSTRRRVYVFDDEDLDEHERFIVARETAHLAADVSEWPTDVVGTAELRWREMHVRVDYCNHVIPVWAQEEVCGFFRIGDGGVGPCGDKATHKVGDEDPYPGTHKLTQYICCVHFAALMGPAAPCGIPG